VCINDNRLNTKALKVFFLILRMETKENLKIVEKDCKACGLNKEDAMDRSRWRRQIWIFDDHDECEWVNVSSGTGSPRLSRTGSTEVEVG